MLIFIYHCILDGVIVGHKMKYLLIIIKYV